MDYWIIIIWYVNCYNLAAILDLFISSHIYYNLGGNKQTLSILDKSAFSTPTSLRKEQPGVQVQVVSKRSRATNGSVQLLFSKFKHQLKVGKRWRRLQQLSTHHPSIYKEVHLHLVKRVQLGYCQDSMPSIFNSRTSKKINNSLLVMETSVTPSWRKIVPLHQ
jgi:hypothetical protein